MANVGDEIICPNCKTNSFLVKHSIMNGWSKVGETLNCSSCNLEIDKIIYSTDNDETTIALDNDKNHSIDKLSKLFGDEPIIKPILFNNDSIEVYFCRDCLHYISHPFLDRCDLHNKNVNPMDDCDQFEPKIDNISDSESDSK